MSDVSNFPVGFSGFQTEIQTLAESLGGCEAVRIVVASEFAKALQDTIKYRLFGKSWDYATDRLWVIWTEATDADFVQASKDAHRYFHKHTEPEPVETWESATLNATITLRGADLYLERGENAIFLACGRADDHARVRLHPAQTTRRDPWTVSLMDRGEMILKVLKKRPDKAGVTTQGLAGAQKTLIRFAALFL